ncbi:MAG: DUF3794 domain-containing protein [Clostridium sp.]
MSHIDVIKENVQYEQLLRESVSNHVLKGEYLIRDSHPDVHQLLGIDAKACITSKEVLADKVMVEGNLDYNLLYLSKDENGVMKIYSVPFNEKFSNYLDLKNEEHKVVCDVDCKIEHIEARIMNERKISIDGILALNWELYRSGEFEYVKDIEGAEDIQIQKTDEEINQVKGEKKVEMLGKSMIKATLDKPEIDEVIKCTCTLHKKQAKLGDDKVYIDCYCKIDMLYKGKDTGEIVTLKDDIYLSKEDELVGVTNDMISSSTLDVGSCEYSVVADDLGENRVVNLEFLVNCKVKVFSKEKIDIIKDAYSPSMNIDLDKQKYDIGIVHGTNAGEAIVKDNIDLKSDDVKIEQILDTVAEVSIQDKEIMNDKVKVNGIMKVSVLYKTAGDDCRYDIQTGELPFEGIIDVKGAKPGMDAVIKASVENLDAAVEANTIAIRANICLTAKVCYKVEKEWVVDILESNEEKPEIKASVTLYVVDKGDTLWGLAKKYHTTVDAILKLNDIEDEENLVTGQKLIIPGRAIF